MKSVTPDTFPICFELKAGGRQPYKKTAVTGEIWRDATENFTRRMMDGARGDRVRFAFVRSLKWIKGSGKFLPAAETPGYGRQPVGRYFIAKTIQLWQSPWKLNRHSNLSESLCYHFADLMLFSVQNAETFTKEITDGIGGSGINAGILKVATQANSVSPYEEMVLRAAARTAKARGTRITTHTDSGTMGREQLDIFAVEGVNLKHVIVGHSCGSADLRYHVDMRDRGCMLGFDQFGVDLLHPDRLRTATLIGLLGIGFEKQIFLSHDSVWYWRGRPLSGLGEIMQKLQNWNPMHIFKNIIPALREAGVPQEKIDTMLIENPRRFFSE